MITSMIDSRQVYEWTSEPVACRQSK